MPRRSTSPYAQLARYFGGRPQVCLHGDDLSKVASTYSSWPGRRGSVDVVGVNSPVNAEIGWGGRGYAGMRCGHLRPGGGQYDTFNAEALNYGAATAFTWVFAARIKSTAVQRNLLFLGSSNTANNWRGVYLDASNNIGLVSNRSGTTETDAGSAAAVDEQAVFLVSLSAAGALLIKQLTSSGEATLLSTTHTMTGTLNVDRFSWGAAILNGLASSYTSSFRRFLALYRGAGVDTATGSKILRLVRDRLGCPLPSANPTNMILSVPSGIQRWYNASHTGALPTVTDLSGHQNAVASAQVSLTGSEFDFTNNGAAAITGTYHVIPAGTVPFTLIASVRRVAGRTWDSATNMNILSSANLMVTLLIRSGGLHYHYNAALFSGAYNALDLWTPNARHVVALVYDGNTLRCHVDNPLTPVKTDIVGDRISPAEMHLGHYNGGVAGSWLHKAKDFAIYNRALSGAELEKHFKAIGASSVNWVATGDSNIARVGKDFLAPAGEVGIWDQARRHIFPAAGIKPKFLLNDGQSGSMWSTPGFFAPDHVNARVAPVAATLDANEWNVIAANCGTNDVHQSLYSGNMNTVAEKAQEWAEACRATGKFKAIGLFGLPPAEDTTFNTRLTTLRGLYQNLKTTGVVDFLIEPQEPLLNPLDRQHFLRKGGSLEAEHWNGLGAKKMAQRWLDVALNGIPYHD